MIELKQEKRTQVPFPSELLRDRVAIVTGGSRGIGRSTVLRLAEAGCNVVINYRQNHPAARETARRAREVGVEAITLAADISRNGEALALAEQVVTHFGRVDILVANAGIWEGARIEEMPEELWDRVLEVNLKGTWNACRAVVPVMRRQGQGSIVIVSSTAGQRGEAHYSNYAASKGGQISFTKSLAVELAPRIRVNCVAPGWVETELNDPVFQRGGFKEQVAGAVPLGRIAQPGDVARSIVFLASDWAQHITGEVLNVNGGAVLCG